MAAVQVSIMNLKRRATRIVSSLPPLSILAKVLACTLAVVVSAAIFHLRHQQPHAEQSAHRALQAIQHSNTKDPIILLGLPRSGSLAIHNFFQCNNITSRHYCCRGEQRSAFPCDGATCAQCAINNWKKNQPAFYHCGNAKVYAQFDAESTKPYSWFLPQSFALPLLYRDYPQAVWILNRRATAQQWATSVLHWYSISNRLFNAFGLKYYTDIPESLLAPVKPLEENDLKRDLEKSIARARDDQQHERRLIDLMTVYDQHTQNLKSFTEKHGITLIEIDVDDAEAGTVLSTHFDGLVAGCWRYDADELDNDWQNFTLPF
jgi:Sulfotransferase domain